MNCKHKFSVKPTTYSFDKELTNCKLCGKLFFSAYDQHRSFSWIEMNEKNIYEYCDAPTRKEFSKYIMDKPVKVRTAEEQLDDIYHTIPEWVHDSNNKESLANKVKNGFKQVADMVTKICESDKKEKQSLRDFNDFLITKLKSEFGKEYWEFLNRKEK